MAESDLLRLVPDAPAELAEILDPARGPVERPNRSEIFGPERFAQHGRSLAETHAAAFATSRSNAFFPRLRDNVRVLREAQRYIGTQATTGYDVSPAAEWLLDNFHLIEAQLREINDGLPRRYFRDLPVLQDEPLVGLPRIYGVAWAFVAHTDSAFDDDLLVHFLRAYEEVRELTLGELWALPTTLRVVLIENLRRLAERAAANKAAREIANLCCDRIEGYSPEELDRILALLNRRGVGDAFLAQMAQQLQDHRSPANQRFFDWLQRVAPHLAEIQTRLPAAQAADNLSVSNAIMSLRSISDADWPDIVASTSVLTQLMLTSPAFAAERDDTRDQTLHAIEKLARKSGRSEREVATLLLELMHGAESSPESDDDDDAHTVANHWLRGAGRGELRRAVGLGSDRSLAWQRWLQRAALPVYLGAIGADDAGPRRLAAGAPQRRAGTGPGRVVAERGRGAAAALPGLRSRGGADQPADQRVGATGAHAAPGVRERHSGRAPADGGDPGDADRARVGPRARARPASCTTSPIPSDMPSSRCSPTGPMPMPKALPATRPCSPARSPRSSG